MKYRVFWNPYAEEELERITKISVNPEQIAKAVESIDRSLIRHPTKFGESRDGNLRVAFEYPIAVLFEVFKEERTVAVYRVWQCAQ